MLFPDLRLFKEIAFHRSVSRGAESCGISQSAASQQLADLEKKLGAKLLDRSTRPLELTPIGRLYYRLCRQALELEENFLVEIETHRHEAEGLVRVASIYSVGIAYLQRLQEEFAAHVPGAQAQVSYMRPDKVYEAVLEGQADLGLVSYPAASREITVIPWRKEPMAVALHPSHRLAARKWLRPADLQGEDYIGFDQDLTISREVERYLAEQGVGVNVAMRFDNTQSIKEAVAAGSGISLLPAHTLEAEVKRGSLVSLPLREPELARPMGIVHLKRKRFSRAALALIELLAEQPEPALARV